jgi:outer membrane protein OmpA-like peptidoglycan-associated protein
MLNRACRSKALGGIKRDHLTMKSFCKIAIPFPSQLAVAALASAFAVSVWAQGTPSQTGGSQNTLPAATQQQSASADEHAPASPKEGFWGRINPMARKKWVKRQTDPINDRLSELDEVNAKNARDIRDVDSRAQAGIQRAQASADTANQTALTANTKATAASATAQQASQQVDELNTTVGGLDQYHQVSDLTIPFRAGSPELSADARAKLDELATSLSGRKGYILEIEAFAPASGAAGIQSSARQAEAVKRYLVTEHKIPVYRMHSVALGNSAQATGEQEKPAPAKTGSVHLRLMENTLAASAAASPQSATTATGAEQP